MVTSNGKTARWRTGAVVVALLAITTAYAEPPHDGKTPQRGRTLERVRDQELRWEDIDYSAINGANYVPTYAYYWAESLSIRRARMGATVNSSEEVKSSGTP